VGLAGVTGVRISALTGEGLDRLLTAIDDAMPVKPVRKKLLLPFTDLGVAADIRATGEILSEEYTAEGLLLEALVEPILAARMGDKYDV